MAYRFGQRDPRWRFCVIAVFLTYSCIAKIFSGLIDYLSSLPLLRQSEVWTLAYRVLEICLTILVIATPLVAYWLYRTTVKWEVKRDEKKLKEAILKDSETFIEKIWKGIPQEIIAECEAMRGDGAAIQRVLMEYVGKGEIDRGYGEGLMILYHKLKKPESQKTLEAMKSRIEQRENTGSKEPEEKKGFERNDLDTLKLFLDVMNEKEIDQVWDRYMQRAADTEKKEKEETKRTSSENA